MQTKPRSIKAKRENSISAWEKWSNGEISGLERDKYSKPYLDIVGLESGTTADVDAIREIRNQARKELYSAKRAEKARLTNIEESKRLLRNAKRQKSEKNRLRTFAKAEVKAQKAAQYDDKAKSKIAKSAEIEIAAMRAKEQVRQKEEKVKSKLLAGELKITNEMQQSLIKGKKTPEELANSIQRWKDATERSVRKSMDKKEETNRVMQQSNYRKDTDREPGIEWKGGQLRSGSMSGEVMNPVMAAIEFADKYHRSSMPPNNIVPNVNVRGTNDNEEIIDGKVDSSIIAEICRQSRAGIQPDTKDLIRWINEWCADNDIAEIDLFADDADLFDT